MRVLLHAAFTLFLIQSTPIEAWSLRTHLWVAQQVIDDVIDDCHVQIPVAGGSVRKYSVPSTVCNALRNHPHAYRAGALGPDTYPDLVVGQMTTHPGVSGGWQTDDWLRHVLNEAAAPEDIAFAYGFVTHAASDMFAHSYINHYAGDIFVLSDGETAVELRHFSLEKYIESRTPTLVHQGALLPLNKFTIAPPSTFASETLIFKEAVARQYWAARFGVHLSALHVARGTVREASKDSQVIVDGVLKIVSEYYKLKLGAEVNLGTAKLGLAAAKEIAKGAQDLLDQANKALALKAEAYEKILGIIETYPGLINGLTASLEVQAKLLQQLGESISFLESEVTKANSAWSDANRRLQDLVVGGGCDLVQGACHNEVSKICDLPGACPGLGAVCCVTNLVCDQVVPKVCTDLRNEVKGLLSQLDAAKNSLSAEIAKRTKALADEAAFQTEKAKKELDLATARAARAGAELDLAVARKQVETAQAALNEAKKAIVIAEEVLAKAEEALNAVKHIIGQLEDWLKKYNLVTQYFQHWLAGLNQAGTDYIDAGTESSLRIINASGNALEPYQKWLQCSLMKVLGVPYEVPFAYCEVVDKFEEFQRRVDEAIADLPELLQWVVDPVGKMNKIVMEKVKPEIWKAVELSADFVLGPPTGRFIHMLAQPELATRESLNRNYSSSVVAPGKALLHFDSVADLVDKDIALSASGQFALEAFPAMRDSIVLSKLALLAPDQLNLLYEDLVTPPRRATRYGWELYSNYAGNFSLLLNAVRSIDGNHQWQPYGLPYPRASGGAQPSDSASRQYGRHFIDDPEGGFRLFSEPTAREDVFLRIFAGPVEGEIRNAPQLGNYPFPSCGKNAFPRTSDDLGTPKDSDLDCASPGLNKWLEGLGDAISAWSYRAWRFLDRLSEPPQPQSRAAPAM